MEGEIEMYGGDRFGGDRRSSGSRNFRDQRSGGGGGGFAPVKVGEELTVKIEAVGEKGDGIAKKDGFVLFVPNTSQGDEVKVKVTKVLRKVGFAEVVGKEGSKSAPKEESEEDYDEDSEQSEGSEESTDSEEETSEKSDDSGEEDSGNYEDSEEFGEEEEEK